MEAAFVGMLLVTSVAFVMTLEEEGPPPRATRAPLEDAVRDLLEGLHDVPTLDGYQRHLDLVVAKAVQGNTSAVDRLVDRTLPPGAECRAWLDNGHSRRVLAGSEERLARESVSSSRLWRPAWSYAFAVPSFDVVASAQPLEMQGYAVAQGSLVKEHGVPVVVEVRTSAGLYERAGLTSVRDQPTASLTLRNETGQSSFHHADGPATLVNTTVYSDSDPGPPTSPANFTVPSGQTFLDVRTRYTGTTVATTLTLTSPNGVPYTLPAVGAGTVHANLTIADATPGLWTLESSGDVLGSPLAPASSNLSVVAQGLSLNQNWTFVVREEAGRAMPAGTNLTLRFPSVFSGLEETSTTQSGWRNVEVRLSLTEGYQVTAELDSPLSSGERTFSVVGKRPANGDALYLLRAELANGTWARSSFVLSQATGITSTTNDIQRGAYLSLPKPMAPGSTATWGVVFNHASSTPGLAETVTRVDLRTADGSALFAGVSGLAPASGWTLLSPRHLQWTGSVAVAANAATTFAARVTAVANESAHEPAHRLPLAFEGGTTFETPDHARTYVHAVNVPPAEDALGQPQRGYKKPLMTGSVPKGASVASVDWYVRGVRSSGDAAYEVSTFPPLATVQEALRLGLARSHLNLSTTSARIGERVEIQVDFQGLLDQAGVFGATVSAWNTELAVYDPAQPFKERTAMRPSYRGSVGSNLTLVPAAVDLQAIAPWVPTQSEVRTTASANVTFEVPKGAFYGPHAVVAQTTFVLNDGLGNALPQTARLLGVLDVVPDSGQAETALYWVTMECWLPEW